MRGAGRALLPAFEYQNLLLSLASGYLWYLLGTLLIR
jgi:hypothetical protein